MSHTRFRTWLTVDALVKGIVGLYSSYWHSCLVGVTYIEAWQIKDATLPGSTASYV